MMHPKQTRRTEQLTLAAEPELRAAIEREAERRDSSISSTIRAMIRAQLRIAAPTDRAVA